MISSFVLLICNFMITSAPQTPFPPTDLAPFSHHKKIPKVIEKSILIALSHYPELKDTPIDFVFKKEIKKSVMQAQPKISTLLNTREDRGYQINISAMFKLTHSTTPIHQLPEGIMIGWIGHELGHVMDYKNRSTLGLMRFGLGYLFSEEFLKKAERTADTYAVNHGLAKYILQTKRFILDNSDLPEVYKARIGRLYLSPDDIVEQVRKLEEAKQQHLINE